MDKTTKNIPHHRLSQLSELIASEMGLYFPQNRWKDLERRIASAAREFDFVDIEEFSKWLIMSPLTKRHIGMLANHLTVGETYFFREKESFRVLEEHVLPELIHSKQKNERRLRIWSAGCSTGEEPYSIAILLDKMIADLKDWNITILATDINTRALRRMPESLFTEWSFRGTPPWVKERYFKMTREGLYEIIPAIKKMVVFDYLNLAEDIYPSLLNNTNAMELILCRNVLMYFTPERAKKVFRRFYNSLVDGGWLLTGPIEALKSLSSQFVTVNFPGAILYRKGKPEIHEIQQQTGEWMGGWEKSENREAEINTIDSLIPPLPDVIPLSPDATTFRFPESTKSFVEEDQNKIDLLPASYKEAFIMFESGRYAKAAETLEELHLSGQSNPKITALLARACANQGRLDNALKWCEKAIASERLNPSYHYLLATILLELGRLDDTITSLKRALYLDHNFVLAYFVLGNIMSRQENFKASTKYLKNASDLLAAYSPDEKLPESEGLTAGRLREIIDSMIQKKSLVSYY